LSLFVVVVVVDELLLLLLLLALLVSLLLQLARAWSPIRLPGLMLPTWCGG
jgi:hypothetical protein